LASRLDKPLGPEESWAESWEIADLDADQSIVEFGPLAGTTLGQLVQSHGKELLLRHWPQKCFPLLIKYLDAAETLSVQVHPNDRLAAMLDPPRQGKTEAWVVVEAEPPGLIYAGLKPDVDRRQLTEAIAKGKCAECLHSFPAKPGDCVLLPAGTVHALGAGLLVAEIQQPSDVTYRLFDWNRVGPDGRPRELHIKAGLEAVDFSRGPVEPVRPSLKQTAQLTCDKFVLCHQESDRPLGVGGDERFHVIMVLSGAIEVPGDPSGVPLPRGGTLLLPACLGQTMLTPLKETTLLDVCLPS
jgi:mannose-6-phosphate isomerase